MLTPRCGKSRRSPSSTNCARARRMKALRSVRARRALCPRQGQDVGQGRAAAALPGIASPISAPAAATRFLWQRWCVEALKEGIGEAFTGTSNVLLAMDNDLEALGTNAHELPMVAMRHSPTDDEELQAVALQGAARLEPLLWRQSADRPARCLRHRRLPARRAGLGGRLDRLPPRQRAADRRRRKDHRVVAQEGPRPQPSC
jgi:hypothetical protein